MKRTVPLLITAIVGFVLVCSAFVPAAESWGEKALIWFDLLAGIAFILGGGNLVGSHLKKISNRRKGWAYSLITLVAFLATLAAGVFKFGVTPSPNQEFYGESFAQLPVSALPVTTFAAAIPAEVVKNQLPASVRRQVSVTPTEFRVAGWLSGAQVADLSDAHFTLEWQCAVERLASVAVPPAAYRGRLSYQPDHNALSFKGVMSESEQAELKQLAPGSPEFSRAINDLAAKSRLETTIAGATPPSDFALPDPLKSKVVIADGSMRFIGPMSSAERAALSTAALRSRIAYPMPTAARDAYEARLAAGSPLNDEQKKSLDRIVTKNWAEDLIATVNTAGVGKPGTKTACDLIADRNAGVTDLDPVIPAGKNDELNAAQKSILTAFVIADSHDWSDLLVKLEAARTLADPQAAKAQAAAVEEFQGKLPTIGQRDRQLFDELIAAGPLNPQQREMLLQEYKVEYAWQSAIGQLYAATHQVKYPWSGEFNQQGSQFWWLFEYIFQPIQSMMFALLAFYVASSAFRAFRAKNLEATLLLGTAFIILLGRTYAGALVTAWLPKDNPLRLENLSVDIMRVFNSAGNRAIMIGIALGIASTSLKILLGIDRSHTGGKD